MKRLICITLLLASCKSDPGKPRDIGTACTRNADCAASVCLPIATGLTVCSSTCVGPGDCPPGWTCESLSSGGSALCDCRPSAEICDGMDNDCNGLIDEGCGGIADLSMVPGADMSLPKPTPTNKVDVLFVVDNSPSMQPIQEQLKAAFPTFAAALDGFPGLGAATSFHIGVITTDLGAGPTAPSANCQVGGQGGKLQPIGAAADVGCMAPTGGKSFIEIDQIGGGNNLPIGQTLPQTFTCMASVGDQGCGFEMVLESAYQALHEPIVENADFLRSDALLAVVFVTNEDDCSAPPTTDLFDPNQTATYGTLLSYRCSNFGVMCGSPPALLPYAASGGPLAMCQAATTAVGGKLFEVDRYLDYFTQPGGVKPNPRSVILTSLASTPSPVSTFLGNPNTFMPCAGPVSGTTCAVLLQHSCGQVGGVTGDPAVRLSQVVRSAPNFLEADVCSGNFSTALQSIADAILAARQGQ